jgi:pimeloyl-ACP methyl ester carboxylesterase
MTDIALEHRRAGEGEPLVAIHGIGSCWQVWNPVLPALEARHDVLALSLPGYGMSEPVAGEPTVPALVDAVEEAMEAVGWATAHLVGNSMGGWISAELAARGRARSVVGTSPAGMWTAKELRYSRAILRQSYSTAQRLAPHAERITATAAGRRLVFGVTYARPERLDPGDAAHALRMFAGSPSFLDTLDWIESGKEMPRGLHEIDCPFRVVWGTRDLLLLPRQAPRWIDHVKGAELAMLPGAGHVPMGDDPGQTAAKILEVTAPAGARESQAVAG